jgi:hypothetical protein
LINDKRSHPCRSPLSPSIPRSSFDRLALSGSKGSARMALVLMIGVAEV